MNAEIEIKNKLLKELGLSSVEVINNSHLHQHHAQSPKNGNSHFKLIINDKELFMLNKIEAHQKIYSCLSSEMQSYIHALEIEIINV